MHPLAGARPRSSPLQPFWPAGRGRSPRQGRRDGSLSAADFGEVLRCARQPGRDRPPRHDRRDQAARRTGRAGAAEPSPRERRVRRRRVHLDLAFVLTEGLMGAEFQTTSQMDIPAGGTVTARELVVPNATCGLNLYAHLTGGGTLGSADAGVFESLTGAGSGAPARSITIFGTGGLRRHLLAAVLRRGTCQRSGNAVQLGRTPPAGTTLSRPRGRRGPHEPSWRGS